MKNATLRQLKVFESVARLLSFSRAAEELHLTQPAVSIQVGKLEEHAGNPLFEQLGKKIYLTPAGTELLQISRNIIQQFEAAEHAMTQFKGISGGKLNVGVISAGDYFFPHLLVAFASRHRGVVLNFTIHNREGLLTHISQNLTDLAIMVRPPTDLDTVNQPFAPHPYVVVAAPNHPLVGRVDSFSPASGNQFALLPADNATGNFTKVVQRVPVKVTLDPSDQKKLAGRLVPGMSVNVEVELHQKDNTPKPAATTVAAH